MIDFGKPFVLGWECLVSRLFRPFDFTKWLVMGFAFFLASFLDGSNPTFSFGGNFIPTDDWPFGEIGDPKEILNQWQGWIGVAAAVAGGFLALVALMCWLGAHGQFVLLDNVIHNRAAIVAPWKEFSGLANRLFGFYLLITLAILVLMALELGGLAAWAWHLSESAPRDEFFTYLPIGIVGIIIALTWIPLLIFWFLYLEMGIPIMYHQRCGAWAACGQVGQLIRRRPLDILMYLILRLVIGVLLLSLYYLVGFFTCCVALIILSLPYIGSVLTLPATVFRLGFTLNCLAQMGPEFDAWSRANPPELPATLPISNSPHS